MLAWVTAAIVGGAVFLWPRGARGAGGTPPTVVASPPINPDSGQVIGSPGDLAHKAQQAELDAEGLSNRQAIEGINTASMIAGITATAIPLVGAGLAAMGVGIGIETGLTIGGSAALAGAAGPFAVVVVGVAIVVAFFAAIIHSALNPYDELQFVYSAQRVEDLPLDALGLPYRPDLCLRRTDGGVVVGLPKLLVPEDSAVADTVKLHIPGLRLSALFPGFGAVVACRRSGMFAWRPFDLSTPFSRELVRIMPLLPEYERAFIRTDPYDYEYDGTQIKWSDLAGDRTDEEAVWLLLLQLRRLAAWREMSLASADTVSITAQMGLFYKTAQEKGADFVVTKRGDIGNWLSWKHFPERFPDPAELRRIGGLIMTTCNALDVPMLFRRVQQNVYINDVVSFDQVAWGPDRHRTPAGRGFPGAWRALPAGTMPSPAPEFEPFADYPDPVWLARKQHLTALVKGLLKVAAALTTAGVSGAANDATLVQAQLDLQAMGNAAPMISDTPPPPLPDDPHPEQAFTFECWLHTGSVRVSSRRFLGVYGSHAAVRQALEAGQVAWHPLDNSAGVAEVWRWYDQTLETINGMFDGWQPFNPETAT